MVLVRVIVGVRGVVFMRVSVAGRLVRREHIHFGRGQPAAAHFAHFETRADMEGRGRLREKLKRDPGIDQRAQKHVAADA